MIIIGKDLLWWLASGYMVWPNEYSYSPLTKCVIGLVVSFCDLVRVLSKP